MIVRRDLRDTPCLPEPWGVAMPVRSLAFGTLTIIACCLLPHPGQPARANTEPNRSAQHHKSATTTATPVQLPAFQAGLWQYRQTVMKDDSPTPRISMLRKCADPSAEIREKMAQLKRRSCEFAPLAHRHGRYFSNGVCPTPLGPTRIRAVLIARGAGGYTDLSETRTREHLARQRIEATRIGECPGSGTLTPPSPNSKLTPHPEVRG